MRRLGKSFAFKVDNGADAVKSWSEHRPYKLPRTPSNHEWAIGQQVVYVQQTAAGWMPTSITGTIVGFAEGRPRKAEIRWDHPTRISGAISFQRLRPHDFLQAYWQRN